MNKIELMSLNIGHYEMLKDLRISRKKLDIIKRLNGVKMTSRELAKVYDTTVQNCTTQLAELHKQGYLAREAIEDPTGGHIYEYTVTPGLLLTGSGGDEGS